MHCNLYINFIDNQPFCRAYVISSSPVYYSALPIFVYMHCTTLLAEWLWDQMSCMHVKGPLCCNWQEIAVLHDHSTRYSPWLHKGIFSMPKSQRGLLSLCEKRVTTRQKVTINAFTPPQIYLWLFFQSSRNDDRSQSVIYSSMYACMQLMMNQWLKWQD